MLNAGHILLLKITIFSHSILTYISAGNSSRIKRLLGRGLGAMTGEPAETCLACSKAYLMRVSQVQARFLKTFSYLTSQIWEGFEESGLNPTSVLSPVLVHIDAQTNPDGSLTRLHRICLRAPYEPSPDNEPQIYQWTHNIEISLFYEEILVAHIVYCDNKLAWKDTDVLVYRLKFVGALEIEFVAPIPEQRSWVRKCHIMPQ